MHATFDSEVMIMLGPSIMLSSYEREYAQAFPKVQMIFLVSIL